MELYKIKLFLPKSMKQMEPYKTMDRRLRLEPAFVQDTDYMVEKPSVVKNYIRFDWLFEKHKHNFEQNWLISIKFHYKLSIIFTKVLICIK